MNAKWKLPFFRFAASQAFSIIGSGSVQFALTWWITVKTGSAIMLSIATLSAFIPALVLGPFAGVWVDRFRRKHVIIIADIFIGIVSVIFAIYIGLQDATAATVCVVILIRSIGSVFQTPAVQSTITVLVPQEHLMQANGYNQFIHSGANMLSPVLGAALYAVLPLPAILLFDLVGAVFASSLIATMKINDDHLTLQKEKQHFFVEMKEGLAAFISDKRFITAFIALFFAIIFFMPVSALYPLMISDYFKASAADASVVEVLFAIGMMLGAVVVGMFKVKNKLRFSLIGMVLIGFTTALYWFLPMSKTGFVLFVLISFFLGLASNFYGIPLMSYMQQSISPEKQGRAFALLSSLMSITMPIGLFILAPIAETKGVLSSVGIAGASICVISLIGIFALSVVSAKIKKAS